MMRRIILGLFLSVLASAAFGQSIVVGSCPEGTTLYTAGQTGRVPAIDIHGTACTSGAGGGGGGAVTNAGTFAVQNTAATPAGANVIGALTANQSVNVSQFGGVSTSTGQVAVSTAPVTGTNTALVVDLRPDSPGIVALGGTTPSASVPTVAAGYTYAHVAAGQATTVIKASAGVLHSIVFNGPATASNVTTVYDNASTSGTVIAIPAATATTLPVTLMYDVAFINGLTIITATANGADMTVSFR